MSKYRESKRDVAIANEFLADQLACAFCGVVTPREVLATYSARCRSCYDTYLAEANPRKRIDVQDAIKRVSRGIKAVGAKHDDPRAWAKRLRERELHGERLSIVQREAWRASLGASAPMPEDNDALSISDRKAEQQRRINAYAARIGVEL